MKTMLRLAGAGDGEVPVVTDQVGSPTFAADLAGMIRLVVAGRRPGLFHVTNQGVTSWHGFAQAVFRAAGHDPERVTPIATADLDPARPAPRPANSVLDNAALRLSGLRCCPTTTSPLKRLR